MSKASGSRGGGKHTKNLSPKTSSKDKRESGTAPRADATARDRSRHIDALLDAALEATFPASDPVAASSRLRVGCAPDESR